MEERQIYRKVALERLSSPEQLDQLMRVTAPIEWVALLSLGVLMSALFIWSLVGRIPVQVSGPAVLINSGGIKNIAVARSGQIQELRVARGDEVQEGEVIAILEGGGEVKSPFKGRILALRADRGSVVERGMTIASLEFVGDDVGLETILYLSPEEGYQVKPGMDVAVSPITVRSEEGGYLLGKVLAVTEFPVTREGMIRVLGSEELVEALAVTGTAIEVHVGLEPEAGSPSGYRWSSPNAATTLSSGTMAQAIVTIERRRPISFVLPIP